ncbi:hypothetical protein BH09BAC4_BH09BAC4_47310 [soil metagenome]
MKKIPGQKNMFVIDACLHDYGLTIQVDGNHALKFR